MSPQVRVRLLKLEGLAQLRGRRQPARVAEGIPMDRSALLEMYRAMVAPSSGPSELSGLSGREMVAAYRELIRTRRGSDTLEFEPMGRPGVQDGTSSGTWLRLCNARRRR